MRNYWRSASAGPGPCGNADVNSRSMCEVSAHAGSNVYPFAAILRRLLYRRDMERLNSPAAVHLQREILCRMCAAHISARALQWVLV